MRPLPYNIAEEIVSVQPMTSSVGEIFKSRGVTWVINCYGDIVHSFVYGYMWYSMTGKEKNGWTTIDGSFCHIEYKNDIRTKDSGMILLEEEINE